jgi:hypothetical protein
LFPEKEDKMYTAQPLCIPKQKYRQVSYNWSTLVKVQELYTYFN